MEHMNMNTDTNFTRLLNHLNPRMIVKSIIPRTEVVGPDRLRAMTRSIGRHLPPMLVVQPSKAMRQTTRRILVYADSTETNP